MKYFYDTEFLENGQTIDLISIGIVADDGREYSAVCSEVGEGPLHKRICERSWLMDHVVPHLPLRTGWDGKPVYKTGRAQYPGSFSLDCDDPRVLPRWVIAKQVRAFLLAAPDPQLWAYYGAYDHVALCQLWGRMVDLPQGIPMFTNDLKQEAVRLGCPELPAQVGEALGDGKHDALADARWNRDVCAFLAQIDVGRCR